MKPSLQINRVPPDDLPDATTGLRSADGGSKRVRRLPLTVDEHRELGRQLLAAKTTVQNALLLVSHRYGTSKLPVAKARRAEHAIDTLRCQLDSQAARDLGPAFDTRLYYPGPSTAVGSGTGRPAPIEHDRPRT